MNERRWLNERACSGAIIFRFLLGNSSFVFINAHLAAGEGEEAKRERDIRQILDAKLPIPSPSLARDYDFDLEGGGQRVLDHDAVFFSGDLNMRIDLPRAEVLARLERNDLEYLLSHDELCEKLRSDPSYPLHGFTERHIQHRPT